MRQHQYKATVKWTGNQGSGTKDYQSYERSHLITIPNKTDILGSSDPSFRGDPKKHNPEELFLSSLSACHMLWYLHLCSVHHILVTDYIDEAIGYMEESEDGSGRFTEVLLSPTVVMSDNEKSKLALSLHEKANQMCFIANSTNFPVNHRPKIIIQ